MNTIVSANFRNKFCSFCGTEFVSRTAPLSCGNCGAITYANPIPVAVVLVPFYEGGVLLVKRSIAPYGLALPGGFMELGETWQESGAREVFEETGIKLDATKLKVLENTGTHPLFNTPNGNILVFMISEKLSSSVINNFVPNSEVSEISVGNLDSELVFPAHQSAMRAYLNG